MNTTVILCTYNRCDSLVRALESAAALTLPDSHDWEVLVVDNNSTDRTRQVVDELSRRCPGRFRYLFEPQQGKSFALNAGIREAHGDVLAFVDDDATVEPSWLRNLTASLQDGRWAGAAGRILPQRNFTAPRWLSLEGWKTRAPLVIYDLGPNAGELNDLPFGTNMAFRREMFEQYGGFRSDLGPRPSEVRGEDSEFAARLLRAGERLRYEPSAVVYHEVPEARLRKAYFLRWWLDKARADIRAFGIPADTRGSIAGVPLVFFLKLATSTVRWMLSFEPALRFSRKIDVWIMAGRITECRRQAQALKDKQKADLSPVALRSSGPTQDKAVGH